MLHRSWNRTLVIIWVCCCGRTGPMIIILIPDSLLTLARSMFYNSTFSTKQQVLSCIILFCFRRMCSSGRLQLAQGNLIRNCCGGKFADVYPMRYDYGHFAPVGWWLSAYVQLAQAYFTLFTDYTTPFYRMLISISPNSSLTTLMSNLLNASSVAVVKFTMAAGV